MASASYRRRQCFAGPLLAEPEWRVLDRSEIDWLNAIVMCRAYAPGQCIFHEGDACQGLYIICEGLVALRKHDGAGASVLIRLAETGDILGYRSLLAEEPYQTTAEVLKPSRVGFVATTIVHELIARKPDLAFAFLRRVCHDLGEAQERFHLTVTQSLRARVAYFLLLMKEDYGTETPDGSLLIELPISRRDMAEMIGVRSESLSRTIRQMTDDGILAFSGHRAWIGNTDRLLDELGPHVERHPMT